MRVSDKINIIISTLSLFCLQIQNSILKSIQFNTILEYKYFCYHYLNNRLSINRLDFQTRLKFLSLNKKSLNLNLAKVIK